MFNKSISDFRNAMNHNDKEYTLHKTNYGKLNEHNLEEYKTKKEKYERILEKYDNMMSAYEEIKNSIEIRKNEIKSKRDTRVKEIVDELEKIQTEQIPYLKKQISDTTNNIGDISLQFTNGKLRFNKTLTMPTKQESTGFFS